MDRPLHFPARPTSTIVGAALIALLLLFVPTFAGAAVKTFRPVHKAPRAITFKPRGVEPRRVRHAVFRLHRGGHVVERRVNIHKVRRALQRRHPIRLRKPPHAKPGRLVIDLARKRTNSASTGCAFGTFSSTNHPGACWRPYSDASPFNTPLPADEQPASNSSVVVGNWLSTWSATDRTSAPRFSADNSGTFNDYDHPIYYSQPGDPVYTVHCTESWGRCAVEGAQVRIPAGAQAAGGSDGHMAVIDQSSGWEYDFWQAEQKPSGGGTLDVSWGGKTRIDGSGLDSGATAADFGLAAGIIRPEELAAGEIDHALFMVVKCTNGTHVYPADHNGRSCSSIGLSNADAPAMGQHFYLDMSDAEIDALSQPAWAKTILRAMARYGLYVGDTGGGCLKIESGSSYTSFGLTDPWTQVAQNAGISPWRDSSTGRNVYSFDLSRAVDWSAQLKVASS